MTRVFRLLIFLGFLFFVLTFSNSPVYAADCTGGNPPGQCFVSQVAGNCNSRPSQECDALTRNSTVYTYVCCVTAVPTGSPNPSSTNSTSRLNFDAIQQQGNPNFTFNTIGDIVVKALPYIFLAAGVLLLLYLLWGGISLMLTKGDPKAIEAAKGKITSAFIGFVIIFVAYWLVQIIAKILGLQNVLNIFK